MYLQSENKGHDQLQGDHASDLLLCFGYPNVWLIIIWPSHEKKPMNFIEKSRIQ